MATKKILFVNGSPNRNGNTATIAHKILSGTTYETLNLIDYKIYPLGQNYDTEEIHGAIHRLGRLTMPRQQM